MIISVQIFLGKSICFNQRRVHMTLQFVFSETFKMDVLSSNSMRCLLTLIPHSSRLQTFAYMTSFSRLKAWGELRKRVDGFLKFWVGRPVSDGSPFWQEKWQGARLNLPSLGLARLFFSLLLFLMQSMWDISDCSTQFVQQRTVGGPAPWAKAKTHTDARGSSLFVERFSLQISKSHSVFGISSRGVFFFFYSWLLGYCGPSLRMTNSDIRSTKRYILLQNRYAFRSKQSHEFINRIIWVFYIAAENMTLIEKRWVGGRENKQLQNTLMIILHFVTELLWKNYVNYKKCCSAKEGFSEDTQVSENSLRKLWIESS